MRKHVTWPIMSALGVTKFSVSDEACIYNYRISHITTWNNCILTLCIYLKCLWTSFSSFWYFYKCHADNWYWGLINFFCTSLSVVTCLICMSLALYVCIPDVMQNFLKTIFLHSIWVTLFSKLCYWHYNNLNCCNISSTVYWIVC